MKKNIRSKKLVILLVVFIGIGFAYLTTQLDIKGITTIVSNTWDIHFENIQVVDGSVDVDLPVIDESKTTVNYSVKLDLPGDFYEFTVDAVNAGTIDAMIESVTMTSLDESLLKIINYKIRYEDGNEIVENDVLKAKEKITYIILVEFKKDISEIDLPENTIDLNFSFSVNYVQSTVIEQLIYGNSWDFDYTGEEEEFIVPETGEYKMQLWGAQGGTIDPVYRGGYGAYSSGTISLQKGTSLYINVGQAGIKCGVSEVCPASYNGGGDGKGHTIANVSAAASGGGASHIALVSGELSTLEEHKKDNKILMIASGGGGSNYTNAANHGIGGDGGGIEGAYASNFGGDSSGPKRNPKPGNQTSAGCTPGNTNCGAFGQGGSGTASAGTGSGGGGGYYGGSGADIGPGAGGSGYIANKNLYDKVMYCYSCLESNEEDTKTISTDMVSAMAIPNYAKKENGSAHITMLGQSNITFGPFMQSQESVNINNINLKHTKGIISFETSLNNTTDYAELTFAVVNNNNVDYYLSKLIKGIFNDTKINYSVTYFNDGKNVEEQNILRANDTEYITVRIQLTEENYTINNKKFYLTLNYDETNITDSYTKQTWKFSYTGAEEVFQVPYDGTYKLEVWGAQGGSTTNCRGGYGAYSVGTINLTKDTNLYINVGEQGNSCVTNAICRSTYNGGGDGKGHSTSYSEGASGGGASHIALVSGELSILEEHKDDNQIVIVSAGGGGGNYTNSVNNGIGGNGGGIEGGYATDLGAHNLINNNRYPLPGGQAFAGCTRSNINCGAFGQGGNTSNEAGSGGGGGYYGGSAANIGPGAGGSGYIGNTNLNNKHMTCYDCTESNASNINTYTISNTCVSYLSKSDCSKTGAGYIKITYVD